MTSRKKHPVLMKGDEHEDGSKGEGSQTKGSKRMCENYLRKGELTQARSRRGLGNHIYQPDYVRFTKCCEDKCVTLCKLV